MALNKEKAIKLAKKLKALAERGVHGEKNSAQEKLDALLKEHGLELYQIEENMRTFERTTLNEGSVILERIIKSVNPDSKIIVGQHKTKLIVEVILSDIEYREVRQKYKFFWRAYNRERKLLLTAFFAQHQDYFTTEVRPKNLQHLDAINPNNFLANVPSAKKIDTEGSAGFRNRPLTPNESQKIRRYMTILDSLDYAKIKEMQDSDSPSDVEYTRSQQAEPPILKLLTSAIISNPMNTFVVKRGTSWNRMKAKNKNPRIDKYGRVTRRVSLSPELDLRLELMAQQEKRKISAMIRIAIEKYISDKQQ